jgi:hypothetical protein
MNTWINPILRQIQDIFLHHINWCKPTALLLCVSHFLTMSYVVFSFVFSQPSWVERWLFCFIHDDGQICWLSPFKLSFHNYICNLFWYVRLLELNDLWMNSSFVHWMENYSLVIIHFQNQRLQLQHYVNILVI